MRLRKAGLHSLEVKRIVVPALIITLMGCGGSRSPSAPKTIAPATVSRAVLVTGLDQPMQYIANSVNAHLAYVLERSGKVRVLVNDALQTTPVLDITGIVYTEGECGLQGMVLAPDFGTSHVFYLQYNTLDGGVIHTRVTRFTMAADDLAASPSGSPVFSVEQPYTNHKGGTVQFGGDGYLYLALGDGGAGNDPGNRAQDPQSLLGKVLRIDPSGDDLPADAENNYRIPKDNPFVGIAGVRGEIWDFGMRNPFRWTVDAKTKALILADVGQDHYEEVDYEPAGKGGRNYGWRVREGLHASGNDGPLYSQTLTDPFLEYDHSVGHSIIGGYIDRTSTLGLKDRYLFADYVDNHLWSIPITLNAGEAVSTSLAASSEITINGGWNGIVAIDPDANGEPIVVEVERGPDLASHSRPMILRS